eukprot:m.96151 g.96151  ORF g.96151 m.96151 type:complete len:262 (-) comp26870_c0_seq1:5-790(-)
MPLPSGVAGVVNGRKQGLRIRNEDPSSMNRARNAAPIKQAVNPAKSYDASQPEKILEGFGVTMLNPGAEHCVAPQEDVQIFDQTTAKSELQQHLKMVKILSSRLLRIRAARAMFEQSPDQAIQYIVKTGDDSLSADIIPTITYRLRNRKPHQQHVTMPACFELLTTLRRMLASPFEDYQVVSLDAIIAISSHWSRNLRAIAKIMNDPESKQHMEHSVSEHSLYISLVGLCSAMAALIRESPRGSPVPAKAQRAAKLLIEFA